MFWLAGVGIFEENPRGEKLEALRGPISDALDRPSSLTWRLKLVKIPAHINVLVILS